MEIWKDIKGFEGYYQVSNMGNVRSLDRTVRHKNHSSRFIKGKILKPGTETCGYSFVCLTKNTKRVYARVHRLVADAFIENKQKKHEVNHIDGNKQNNQVSNLEYATHSENMQHAVKTGLKNRVHPVEMLDARTEKTIKLFPSINSAIKYLQIYPISSAWCEMSRCLDGKIIEVYGFKWKMAKPLNIVETRAKDGKRNY